MSQYTRINGTATMLSFTRSPISIVLIAALSAGGSQARERDQGWQETTAGALVYPFRNWHLDDIRIGVRSCAPQAPPDWSMVEGLGGLTIDVALVLIHLLFAPAAVYQQGDRSLTLHDLGDQLLAYKGIELWGKGRRAWYARIVAEIARLQQLCFELPGLPQQRVPFLHLDSMFNAAASSDLAWSLVTSHNNQVLLEDWLHQVDVSSDTQPLQLPVTLLQFDHRHNRGSELLAKKLGLHLLMQTMKQRHGKCELRVAQLLTAVGELPRNKVHTLEHTCSIRTGRSSCGSNHSALTRR